MGMPQKSGKEALDEMRRINPDLKSIFLSGYTADRLNNDSLHDEDINLLFKPVSPKDLLRKVREILDK